MSRLFEMMNASFLVRCALPESLHATFDRISEAAQKHAAAEDAAEARRGRPLAPVVELHGHSRSVS